jgi:hypothetical protein
MNELRTCSSCGQPLGADVQFCGRCGAAVNAGAPRACPSCGATNPALSRFCERCGVSLLGGSTAQPAAPPPGPAAGLGKPAWGQLAAGGLAGMLLGSLFGGHRGLFGGPDFDGRDGGGDGGDDSWGGMSGDGGDGG